MKKNLFFQILFLLVSQILCNFTFAENNEYPLDAVINFKTACGGKGDGVTDDTPAFNKCINLYGLPTFNTLTNPNQLFSAPIYFPNGTYLVTDSITWTAGVNFFGQSRDGVVIKLSNNNPNFQDPSKPKFVIGLADNQKDNYGIGFHSGLYDLTIDIGSGNAGAFGVSFYADNEGGMRNVTVRSSDKAKTGFAGIRCRSGSGPGLVKNVLIDGFKYGIIYGSGVTFENITVQNQSVAGIYSKDKDSLFNFGVGVSGPTVPFHNLKSVNSVPAVFNDNESSYVNIVDGDFNGTGSSGAAIISKGPIFARNIHSSNYSTVLEDAHNNKKAGLNGYLDEYASESYGLFTNTPKSLNLPIEDTPDLPNIPVSQWVSVKKFGANPDDYSDDTDAIQAAFDSGAEVVYFPYKTSKSAQQGYIISKTIQVRGNLKRIIFFYQGIKTTYTIQADSIFNIQNLNSSAISFEYLATGDYFSSTGDYAFFNHNSPAKLIVKNSIISLTNAKIMYKGYANSGNVYIEDISTGGRYIINNPNQRFFARQFNANRSRDDNRILINNGAKVWIMQMRPENNQTTFSYVGKGGYTEHLGLWVDTITHSPNAPAFINDNSHLSISGTFPAFGTSITECCYLNYKTFVNEIKNGVSKNLDESDVRARSGGPDRKIPLYSSESQWVQGTTGNVSTPTPSPVVTSIPAATSTPVATSIPPVNTNTPVPTSTSGVAPTPQTTSTVSAQSGGSQTTSSGYIAGLDLNTPIVENKLINSISRKINPSPATFEVINTGKWATFWNDKYIYFSGKITDSTNNDDSGNLFDDDSVEIYFDLNNNKGTVYDANDYQFVFRRSGKSFNEYKHNANTGVTYVVKNDSLGYTIQIAFPVALFNFIPASGTQIGFDIHVNDDFDGGLRDKETSWNAVDSLAYKFPDRFGTLKFDKTLLISKQEALDQILELLSKPNQNNLQSIINQISLIVKTIDYTRSLTLTSKNKGNLRKVITKLSKVQKTRILRKQSVKVNKIIIKLKKMK